MARKTRKRNLRKDERCERTDRYERRDGENRDKEGKSSGYNDVSWYTRYPNLSLATANFPFPNRPGMEVPLGSITDGTNTFQSTMYVPGVMALDWMPSVGTSERATDPASIMIKEMYAQVRSAFGGSTLAADPPDFGIYIFALDSIFTYIAYLKRLYRVLNVWTPENYVLPDIVLAAMGFTNNDIQKLRIERVQLWEYINELVYMTRKLTCPAIMDLFNRHYWMSDNVYTDAPEINSQFYLFNLVAVYRYEALPMPGTTDDAAGLSMIKLPQYQNANSGVTITAQILYDFGRQLIEDMVAWDDGYIISGYLKKAYDGVPVFMVDELPQNQPFNPVYVEEVLSQIENSRTVVNGDAFFSVPTDFDMSGFNVTQSVANNTINSKPQYTAPFSTVTGEGAVSTWSVMPYLSIRSQAPTVADNIVASRLHAACDVVADYSAKTMQVTVIAATEIPIRWRYVSHPVAAHLADINNYTVPSVFGYGVSGSGAVSFLLSYLSLGQFDWHPFVTILQFSTANKRVITAIAGDTHNFTTISIEDLKNLHRVCVYSELNAFSA